MSRESSENGNARDAGLKLRMRSEERRIASQHKQLEELFQRVLGSVQAAGPTKGVGDFLLFATAFEAHMSVEEDIYFPALHGLRADIADELEALIHGHAILRAMLVDVREELAKDDLRESLTALDGLAASVGRHEAAEEELIARITEGPVASHGHTSLED